MCSAFLWSGSPNKTSSSKVAWSEVCCPYEKGGLGIRRIHEVTTVFVLKLIWRLCSNSSSLWGSWVKQYLLRDESIWDVKDTGLGSWVWRKLLRFRPLAKQFVRMNIGNGQTVEFWTDLWFPKGRLIKLTGPIGTRKMEVRRCARICDVLIDAVWYIRVFRDQHIASLMQEIKGLPLILSEHVPDGLLWKFGPDAYSDRFISSETWHQIRNHKEKTL